MADLTVGSLCSGYGGLEMGLELAIGPVHHAWHGEFDPDASAVLAGNWPGVPNLGDITKVDWDQVPRVDILAAGYPCQGESNAGLRKGADDPRHRWPDVYRGIRALRPRTVLLENVRGHIRRSFPRVIADLAAAGYVGSWTCVRASDVGAAHRRERVVIVACPAANADSVQLRQQPGRIERSSGEGPAVTGAVGQTDRLILLPTPWASDGPNGGPNQRGRRGDLALPSVVVQHADRWGDYGPAIARWELVTGRPAPEPTQPGRLGAPRLSPLFVEWLMGLPEGWVTKHVERRPAALKILGNGAVPQQIELALRQLLGGAR